MEPVAWLLPLAAGLSLAAVAGLRAFLPLFVVGLAARADWLPLGPSFEWLASTSALLAFGSASVLEILADKVPVVDHLLDTIGVVVKPVAGAMAALVLVQQLDPLWAAVIAILAGGTLAGSVHVAKAKTRVGSSLLSFGSANPVLSVIEDGISIAGSVLAVLWPLLALLFLVAAATAAWVGLRLLRRLFRPTAPRPARSGA